MVRTVARMAVAVAILAMASQTEGSEIRCEATVVRQAWDLLKLAQYGQSDQERAAFLMRDAAGREFLQTWPDSHTFRCASYGGRPPREALAIMHTHPNALPYPSVDDERTALRTGLPVYVVTRMMISRTTGHDVRRFRVGDWNPEARGGTAASLCSAQVVVDAAGR